MAANSDRRITPAEAAAIRLLVLDVDGVMTDGRLHFDADGRESKVFHVRDGYGIKQALRCGIELVVISGRRSKAAEVRMRDLGIDHLSVVEKDENPRPVGMLSSLQTRKQVADRLLDR